MEKAKAYSGELCETAPWPDHPGTRLGSIPWAKACAISIRELQLGLVERPGAISRPLSHRIALEGWSGFTEA